MRITADTNVLVRILVEDDEHQARLSEDLLSQADLVALALPALCEVVWVLRAIYKYDLPEIAAALRALTATNVEVDRQAVQAGLAMLDAGGDFAAGVIAFDGQRLGGETFVSFDRKAVARLTSQGRPARAIG